MQCEHASSCGIADSYSMESTLDNETGSIIHHIHTAWKRNASLSEYIILRDQVVTRQDRLGNQIAALGAVARLVIQNSVESEIGKDFAWQEFFALVASLPLEKEKDDLSGPQAHPEYRQIRTEKFRRRNLAVIEALWSPEVVAFYKWHEAGQSSVRLVRACAIAFPNFESDMVPRLNSVLLTRHCRAIQHHVGKTLQEARLQPHNDLKLSALEAVAIDLQWQEQWCTNPDGTVRLDSIGPFLRDLRPFHFNMYLLQKDCYGVLAPRSICLARSPCTSSVNAHVSTHDTSSPVAQCSLYCSSSDVVRARDTEASIEELVSHDRDLGNMTIYGEHVSTESQVSTFDSYGFDSAFPPVIESNDMFPYALTDALATFPQDTPWSVLEQEGQNMNELWTNASIPCVSTHDPFGPEIGDLSRAQRLPINDMCYTGLFYEPVSNTFDLEISSSRNEGTTPRLLVGALPFENGWDQGVEESLHNRHHLNLRAYIAGIASVAPEGQRGIRAQWLSLQTPWARVHSLSEKLGSGSAACEERADVLYCVASDFLAQAKSGKVYETPVVIKERFEDQGMHNITETLALFEDLGPYTSSFQTIGSQEIPHSAPSNMGDEHGLNFRYIRNITRSHRPLFTMLSRYRLLETLSEGFSVCLDGTPADGSQSNLDFSGFCHSGAFHEPQLVATYGRWLRNLQGTSYWMIVPAGEMTSTDWGEFADAGRHWVPSGKERLVVLEEDDVLLVPPGCRVVSAMHFPSSCLMEGGILWDFYSVTDTLRSLVWCYEMQLLTDSVMSVHLQYAVAKLRSLVGARPGRFNGGRDESVFLEAFERIMQDYFRVIKANTACT